MDASHYIIGFIAVATLATFATRAIPFLFFERHHKHPLLLHIGRYLPVAVMALLVVVFLVRSAHWSSPAFGLDALIPCLLVIGVHHWKGNALISILTGTVAYMLIQQGLLGA